MMLPVLLLLLLQTPAPPTRKLSFEVASVHPSPAQAMGSTHSHMNVDGALVRSSYLSLQDYIRIAYRLQTFQVEGPDWITTARFDIAAKLPDGSSRDQIPDMLQSLLTDRFHLSFHRQTTNHAVYALVPDKGGAKVHESRAEPGAPPGERAVSSSSGSSGAHIKTRWATLADLAQVLSSNADRPVLDMSGLQGKYDFDLDFRQEADWDRAAREPRSAESRGGESRSTPEAPALPTLLEALRRYGLKLEPRTAPVEVLVVDQIDRAPTEN